MNKLMRVKELNNLLLKANEAYYGDGDTIMSDIEYDKKMEELKQLEKETGVIFANSVTQNVGYEVKSKLKKVKHNHPMLSLDKCHDAQDLIVFAKDKDCVLSVKCDGLSLSLEYENKKLISARTRGDSEVGNDVLFHALVFDNIPKEISYNGRLVIDGEAVILQSDFDNINKKLIDDGLEPYKNSRNLSAGSLNLLDNKETANRHMKFIAWRVIEGFEDSDFADSNFLKLRAVEKLGFDTAPMFTYTNKSSDKENIKDMLESLKKQAFDIGLAMDGCVMTYDSISYGNSLGRTSKFPNHSVAYKFTDETYETELIEIEWSCSKNSINPVAIFKPTVVGGNTIERASLHNCSYIEDLELGIGDTITIYLANCIIPQVDENLTRSGTCTPPEHCPVCNHKTEIIYGNDGTKTLVCTNDMCKSKLLGRLKTFVGKSGMDIENLSEATLSMLLEYGYVNSFKDIYHLSDFKAELSSLPKQGARSVSKLLAAIEKSRTTTLDRFLASLSIPQCGKSTCKDIAKYCHGSIDEFIFIINNTALEFMTIEKFGNVMLDSLLNWWDRNSEMVHELLEEVSIIKPDENHGMESVKDTEYTVDLSNKTFVITGALNHFSNRDELKSLLESMNAKVSGSVSAKTFALICNEKDSNTGKSKKAKDLGVNVWTEDELLKYIGE